MDDDLSTQTRGRDAYLAEIRSSIAWYKSHANRAMMLFVLLRLVLTVLSAALPALSTDALPKQYLTIAAVTIAVLAALDTQFKWGEEWRQFRSTQLSLERLLRTFVHDAFYPELTPEKRFVKFVEDAEAVMADDYKSFFRFRIKDFRSSP